MSPWKAEESSDLHHRIRSILTRARRDQTWMMRLSWLNTNRYQAVSPLPVRGHRAFRSDSIRASGTRMKKKTAIKSPELQRKTDEAKVLEWGTITDKRASRVAFGAETPDHGESVGRRSNRKMVQPRIRRLGGVFWVTLILTCQRKL